MILDIEKWQQIRLRKKNFCFLGKVSEKILGLLGNFFFYNIFLLYNGIWINEFVEKLFPNMVIKKYFQILKKILGLNYTVKKYFEKSIFKIFGPRKRKFFFSAL